MALLVPGDGPSITDPRNPLPQSTSRRMPTSIAYLMLRLVILVPICIGLHLWVERPARKRVLQWWTARQQRALVVA